MRAHFDVRGVALAAIFSTLAAAGCVDDPDALAVEAETSPIIGGFEDLGSPAVVMTSTSTGGCTGTLVGPRTIITAGHCVVDSVKAGDHSGVARFGSGGSSGFTDTRSIARLAMHRYYSTFQYYDIGMIRLRDPAPADVEPMSFNVDALPGDFIGATVRVVGFGVSDGVNQTGFGTKRTINLDVSSVGPHHIGLGESGRNICQGDSGGPTFLDDFPNGEIVIAVSSYGSNNCSAESQVARTDTYADWLIEVYDAFDGPCSFDGECVTEGCRTPDPDCDPCGFDGVCARDCPRVDLDCPLGEFTGDLCDTDFDCESRTCVAALDDPRIKYCSKACDPDKDALEECEAPLARCSDAGQAGEYVCHFVGPSPGSQGASCDVGNDCRSGACDQEYGICVEPCGDGLPECGGEYSCEKVSGVSVCTFPREAGCSVGGRGGAGGAICFALGVLVALARRRRR